MITEAAALVRLHDLSFGFDGKQRFLSQREEAEAERYRAGIDLATLAKYEQLKRRYGDTAVVEVDGHICTGCRMSLPSSVVSRLRKGVSVCEFCGRLLFSPDILCRSSH